MTTRVTIKNENQPEYALWSVEILGPQGEVLHTLAPGDSKDFWLWNDGRELAVREKPGS